VGGWGGGGGGGVGGRGRYVSGSQCCRIYEMKAHILSLILQKNQSDSHACVRVCVCLRMLACACVPCVCVCVCVRVNALQVWWESVMQRTAELSQSEQE
jgi:hypothetical protein